MTDVTSTRAEQERPEEVRMKELSLVPTSYGRLVYLAGLLDPNTGRYEHYGLRAGSEGVQVNKMLRARHEAIFREWSSYPLEAKMADIELYIAGLHQTSTVELIDAWLRLTPYKNLVPASIQGPERQKHVSDFEAILGLLKNVYGVASADRDA